MTETHQTEIGTLDVVRRSARDAHGRGEFDAAITLHRSVLAEAKEHGVPTVDDFLFLGPMLYGARQCAEVIATLREGATLYPDHAPMRENLGIFLLDTGDPGGAVEESLRAIALGSDSPNVHDCLCDAYSQIGRLDESVVAGRVALEAKDRTFGSRAPLVALPSGLPPPFNWNNPQGECDRVLPLGERAPVSRASVGKRSHRTPYISGLDDPGVPRHNRPAALFARSRRPRRAAPHHVPAAQCFRAPQAAVVV